ARMKKIVSQLVLNITDSSGDLRKLGGALVLADLIDALKRYKDVFDIPKLDQELKKLERIWKESN
ncbi:MAG: hypothetical protein U9N45_01650, partial [Gemmatimonadota bacterium]|nr:hypothetical protein [Gemmatimonadota bacterium]